MVIDLLIALLIFLIPLVLIVFVSPTSPRRRKAISSTAMAGFDEIFSPAAYASRIELEEQSERVVNVPAPEDKKL